MIREFLLEHFGNLIRVLYLLDKSVSYTLAYEYRIADKYNYDYK